MLNLKKVVVVEGFDMVGKSTWVNEVLGTYQQYTPDHDLTDSTVGRSNSWTIGYGIFDLLSQVGYSGEGIVINRGVASSYVYPQIYNQNPLDLQVIEWYKGNKFFKEETSVLYFFHESQESARVIYENSQKRQKNPNKLSDKMDQFKDFEDYWSTYTKAHRLFVEAFNKLGIKPEFIMTGSGGFTEVSSPISYFEGR